MADRIYAYIGSADKIRPGSLGTAIRTAADVLALVPDSDEWERTFTYILDEHRVLRLAPRRSEHVNCAGGARVLAAGEITIAVAANAPRVTAVSNHSTGYCPSPDVYPALAEALDRCGIPRPAAFTTALQFRRCPACRQINIIKDNWFHCDVCDAELPAESNI